ncbi:MAG TPA: Ig-like domain-containing protein, partial [Longimicrobium sp.]|nr:Ig-like domain-containing protein [Longimicrobium sp.]
MTSRLRSRRLPFAALLAALVFIGACDSPTSSGPGTPATLAIVAGDLQTRTVGTELPQQLVVRVLDDKGKPVEGQIVNFRVTAGNGSVFGGSALTDGAGEARERWTLGTVAGDTQRVEARAVHPTTGQALVFAEFRAVGTAAAAASLVAAGSTMLTGLPWLPLADSVAVFVRDAYGNAVAGHTVSWTVRQGGGTVSPATSVTGANGVARASWTLGPQFAGAQVLEAAAGLAMTAQFTANVQLPAGATLVAVVGNGQTGAAGQVLALPLVVRVQRADGTSLAGIPVTFTLPDGSGSVNPSTVVSGTDGTASVSWTLGVGTGPMEATASLPTGSSVRFTATAVAGAPARLLKVAGDAQAGGAGTALRTPLGVRVVDAFGNGVPGATVTWSAPSGSVAPA